MSHHRQIEATVRITNEGEILSLWFRHPDTGVLRVVEEWYCRRRLNRLDD